MISIVSIPQDKRVVSLSEKLFSCVIGNVNVFLKIDLRFAFDFRFVLDLPGKRQY